MITRVRIEATSLTRDGVLDELREFQRVLQEHTSPSAWEEDGDGAEVMTTKQGFWARVTMICTGWASDR